ncbi:hypothetical protein [Leisingera sp. JC11]|uniref:hypothetical protein n=1 Tax=Leisingera sp. JC11 TaxID=3042469 RepID=UPI003451B04C
MLDLLTTGLADQLEARLHELSCEPDFATHPDFKPTLKQLAATDPERAEKMRKWLELPEGEEA